MAWAESSADSAVASLSSSLPPAASSPLDSAGVLFLSSFPSPLCISSSSPSLHLVDEPLQPL
ncbi:hypothetical protein PF007_g28278 [Phytophthora fragariae]|uniref:Uncharacterized protein n=1 Tax=Phytophthora fragariae TaxID=53985 RepID=A0A6A3Q233_9STRA|nr:hypothetical protein PF009_g1148 [Phytophthora fragariae]KAE9066878.1 hypothetical protein PF007_g28278 [Phytophthora fragariae]